MSQLETQAPMPHDDFAGAHVALPSAPPSPRSIPPQQVWYPSADEDWHGEVVSRALFVVALEQPGGGVRFVTDRMLAKLPPGVVPAAGPLPGTLSLWGLCPHVLGATRFADLAALAAGLAGALERVSRPRSAARVALGPRGGTLVLVRTTDALSVSRVSPAGELLDRRIYDAESFLARVGVAVERFHAALAALRVRPATFGQGAAPTP